MSSSRLLLVGVVFIVPAIVIGALLRSWDAFTLACLATGLALLVVSTMLIHGTSSPRSPDENLRQMKANQYAHVDAIEVPADPRAWRSALVCVPALVVGVILLLVVR